MFELPEFSARTLKGLAFGLAGLALAFVAGRLSVWLVPPAGFYGTGSVPISKPSIPLGIDPLARFTAWTPKWQPPEEKNEQLGAPPARALSSMHKATAPDRGNRDPAALERCAARYRSFDPSDGTYQPLGQQGRVLCRFLSR